MLSREEIAEALNVARGFALELAGRFAIENNVDGEDVCIDYSHKFEQLAAQIENMRCETCERYVPGEDDEACTFNQIEYQGKGFGCFHINQRRTTNEHRGMGRI